MIIIIAYCIFLEYLAVLGKTLKAFTFKGVTGEVCIFCVYTEIETNSCHWSSQCCCVRLVRMLV